MAEDVGYIELERSEDGRAWRWVYWPPRHVLVNPVVSAWRPTQGLAVAALERFRRLVEAARIEESPDSSLRPSRPDRLDSGGPPGR
jgi:hypothetical protein